MFQILILILVSFFCKCKSVHNVVQFVSSKLMKNKVIWEEIKINDGGL